MSHPFAAAIVADAGDRAALLQDHPDAEFVLDAADTAAETLWVILGTDTVLAALAAGAFAAVGFRLAAPGLDLAGQATPRATVVLAAGATGFGSRRLANPVAADLGAAAAIAAAPLSLPFSRSQYAQPAQAPSSRHCFAAASRPRPTTARALPAARVRDVWRRVEA
jgi:hypothetical protein